jgi:zeta-carotene desaturase
VKRRVAIIGGGLAGLASAVRLVEADVTPIVLETRGKLGGRATSFVDPRSGRVLDNCQHVLMGCCTNLIDFYDRIGVIDRIRWHDTLYFTDGVHGIDRFRRGILPAPFHFTGSFRRMKIYSWKQKRAIARCMWRMIRLGEKGRYEWNGRTFGEFLVSCNQSEDVVRTFWQPIVVSACNMDVNRVGAGYALHVFQQGFLGNKWSYTMGLPSVPLWELYDPAERFIETRGGEVHVGVSVRAIAYHGSRVTGVVTGDDLIEASAVISTVPPDRLDKLVTGALRAADPRLLRLNEITYSPILGVHLFFDQPVMDVPHLVLAGLATQWLFNKGVDERNYHHVHAVISAADDWMELAEDEIVERVLADIHRALPSTVGLKPVECRSVKEKRATFAAVPGLEFARPSAARGPLGTIVGGDKSGGGVENLYLAGDWCDTGWPATMEGAVRSGYAAAKAITDEGGVVEDVPAGLLAYCLGLR